MKASFFFLYTKSALFRRPAAPKLFFKQTHWRSLHPCAAKASAAAHPRHRIGSLAFVVRLREPRSQTHTGGRASSTGLPESAKLTLGLYTLVQASECCHPPVAPDSFVLLCSSFQNCISGSVPGKKHTVFAPVVG